jgi:hypothetical protein
MIVARFWLKLPISDTITAFILNFRGTYKILPPNSPTLFGVNNPNVTPVHTALKVLKKRIGVILITLLPFVSFDTPV